jgi:UDP-N-acetylmuramate dehydrogenase
MKIYHNVSLKPFNTFGIDCSAEELIEFEDKNEISDFFRKGIAPTGKQLVLGGGSNVLFTRDFDGTILRFTGKKSEIISEEDRFIHWSGEAGINWHEFVLKTIGSGYQGLENLSMIPGSLGAAPIQNIGAYGVEIKSYIEGVEYFDLNNRIFRSLSNSECRFDYRDSIFKHALKNRTIILAVSFKLNKIPVYNILYKDLKKKIEERGITEVSPSIISSLVIEIRKSKLPDPAVTGNAGSFFKNPIVTTKIAANLKKEFPGIVSFDNGHETVKLSAAWMIDQCNLKGYVKGQAGIHQNQPLVIVNLGRATGKEILELAMEVKERVYEKFKIMLEPEINII